MRTSCVVNGGSVSSVPAGFSGRPPLSPSSTPTRNRVKRKNETQAAQGMTVKEQVFQLLAIAVVAGIVATSGFKSLEWAKQQLKPFCDSGSEPVDADNCIPCPPNGFCQQGRLECLPGFKRVGRKCAPDKEIDRTAQKLATFIKSHVCGAAARSVCDGGPGSVWLPEAEVLENLKKDVPEERFGPDETFNLVWEKASTLAREDSVVIQHDLQGKREFHCPQDVAEGYKSIGCRTKELLWRNSLTLFFLSPVVALVGLFVAKLLHRKKLNARAGALYVEVCEALEEKALEAKGLDGGEPWVVVSRLRDHLLSSSERKNVNLWKKVAHMVQEDSRIDQYQKKVKGEQKIVWEWQVEGAVRTPGSRKKLQQRRTNTATKSPHASVQQVHGNGTNTFRFVEELGSPLEL